MNDQSSVTRRLTMLPKPQPTDEDRALEAVVAQSVTDAHEDPQAYLDETEVPAGGE